MCDFFFIFRLFNRFSNYLIGISEDWYIIVEDFNGGYLTIDLGITGLGRCYDSFHELHPVDSPIIAYSFTDLLESLIKNKGQHWYWLQNDFLSLGNAYDE